MADEQGSDPKSLEVRVSQLEDAVRDLTKQLSAGQGAQQQQPWPPCGGQVPCISAGVPCITHYVPCIAHPPCGPYPPPCAAYQHRPPCGGGGGWGPCQ
jgi:hypothetical protein